MDNLPNGQHDDLVSDVDYAVHGSYQTDDFEEEDSDMDIFVSKQSPDVASGPLGDAQKALAVAMNARATMSQKMNVDHNKKKLKPPPSCVVPAPAAPRGQYITSDSKKRVRVFGKKRKVDRNSKKKHSPIGPKGTIFLAKMNKHLDRSKAVLGEPDENKLKIVFKDKENHIHYRHYIDAKAAKWDDPKWIADVNKWRYQVFLRAFKKDPAESRPTRAKWTHVEKAYLEWLIKKKVTRTGARLDGDDWNRIREKHNGRWAGLAVGVGEKLHLGGVAKKNQLRTERSLVAIRGVFDRSTEMQRMVDEIVGAGVENVVASDEEWFILDGKGGNGGTKSGAGAASGAGGESERVEEGRVDEDDSQLYGGQEGDAFDGEEQ